MRIINHGSSAGFLTSPTTRTCLKLQQTSWPISSKMPSGLSDLKSSQESWIKRSKKATDDLLRSLRMKCMAHSGLCSPWSWKWLSWVTSWRLWGRTLDLASGPLKLVQTNSLSNKLSKGMEALARWYSIQAQLQRTNRSKASCVFSSLQLCFLLECPSLYTSFLFLV